jgi:hypothetical protein
VLRSEKHGAGGGAAGLIEVVLVVCLGGDGGSKSSMSLKLWYEASDAENGDR